MIKKIVGELTRFFFAYRREKQAIRTRMDRFIGTLCRQAPWLTRGHIYIRYKTCPFGKIEAYIPKEGKILDLGCGFHFTEKWPHTQIIEQAVNIHKRAEPDDIT